MIKPLKGFIKFQYDFPGIYVRYSMVLIGEQYKDRKIAGPDISGPVPILFAFPFLPGLRDLHKESAVTDDADKLSAAADPYSPEYLTSGDIPRTACLLGGALDEMLMRGH